MKLTGREVFELGSAVEKRLEGRPPMDSAMEMVLDAWRDLDSARPLSERFTGKIPFPALVLWAQLEDLDSEDFALLKDVITDLDEARISRIFDKLKKTKGRK